MKNLLLAGAALAALAAASPAHSNWPGYTGGVDDLKKFTDINLSCETIIDHRIIDLTVHTVEGKVAWRDRASGNSKTAAVTKIIAYPNFSAHDEYGQLVARGQEPPYLQALWWGDGNFIDAHNTVIVDRAGAKCIPGAATIPLS
jgi:hypothetical protein